jgi:hypothetical protein
LSSGKKEATTLTNRVRIRAEDRQGFFDKGAEHLGITAEYSSDSFKKFHRALRQSIQEPSTIAIFSNDASAGVTHYNLRRDFVVKVAPEGHVTDIHRPTAKERHKLVTDLMRDKHPMALIDLLKIVPHISREDQKQVSNYLIKKLQKRKAMRQNDSGEKNATDAKGDFIMDLLIEKETPELLATLPKADDATILQLDADLEQVTKSTLKATCTRFTCDTF